MPLIKERWNKLKSIPLKHGAHSPDSTFCVMEAVAYVAGLGRSLGRSQGRSQ